MKSSRPSKNTRTHILMSNNLKFLRNTKNATQSDVADGISIPRGTYASFECGACLPHLTILERMTEYLGCNQTDIYADLYLGIIKMESE